MDRAGTSTSALRDEMSLSEEKRAELVTSTRQAARALVEDLEHIHDIARRNETSRGELRRLSVTARRLLVNGEITDIAAPRIGKLTLHMPDRKVVFDKAKNTRLLIYASAGVRVFGIEIGRSAIFNLGRPPFGSNIEEYIRQSGLFQDDPWRMVPARLTNFLDQRVLCHNNQWVTRREAIKYVANLGSGAHSGEPSRDPEHVIARITKTCAYRVNDQGSLQLCLREDLGKDAFVGNFTPADGAIVPDLPEVDFVQVEVLAALHFMASSPDVLTLEQKIRRELDIPQSLANAGTHPQSA